MIVAALAAGAMTLAASQPSPQTEPLLAKVDWSGVGDDVIRRCKLQGLENLLLQALIENGLAVVDELTDDGLHMRIAASDEFRITVRLGDVERSGRVPGWR